MSVLAITGGTGFVGKRTIDAALAAGHGVRALTRRPQRERGGVTWVAGALDTPDALAELCRDADAVIHIAGVVNARDRASFAAGNVDGTQAVLDAAKTAGVIRFVHVSSLSAREPDLSAYGWSKAEGDALVEASGLNAAIVRPAAIFGPADHDMLELFRLAKRGVVPLPPPGRFSTLHVDDLAALLISLAVSHVAGVFEVDDETPTGWSHVDFAHALGRAVGRRVVPISTPRPLMSLSARVARAVQGDRARLTPDRAAYFSHPDWVVRADRRPPTALWRPTIATEPGLAATAEWYRREGLL